MKNKHLLLVWKEVSTTRTNICKKLRRYLMILCVRVCVRVCVCVCVRVQVLCNEFRSVSH